MEGKAHSCPKLFWVLLCGHKGNYMIRPSLRFVPCKKKGKEQKNRIRCQNEECQLYLAHTEWTVLTLFMHNLHLTTSCLFLGVRSPERPVVPNVTALSATEMRITWCRVNSNKVEINHYELYIDTQLEYSGIDVMYIAKRLKPWSWYEVKLRACGFSPGSCSPFSRLALVKTLGDGKLHWQALNGFKMFWWILIN